MIIDLTPYQQSAGCAALMEIWNCANPKTAAEAQRHGQAILSTFFAGDAVWITKTARKLMDYLDANCDENRCPMIHISFMETALDCDADSMQMACITSIAGLILNEDNEAYIGGDAVGAFQRIDMGEFAEADNVVQLPKSRQ